MSKSVFIVHATSTPGISFISFCQLTGMYFVTCPNVMVKVLGILILLSFNDIFYLSR